MAADVLTARAELPPPLAPGFRTASGRRDGSIFI